MFVSFHIYTQVELLFFWCTLEDLWVHGKSVHFIWCIIIPLLRSRCKSFLVIWVTIASCFTAFHMTLSQTQDSFTEKRVIDSPAFPPHSTHAHFIIMRQFNSEKKQFYLALSHWVFILVGEWANVLKFHDIAQ